MSGVTPLSVRHETELAKAETKGHCLRKALGGPRKIKSFVGTAKIYATTGQINL